MQLHRHIDEIHAAGAELYVIGNGSPSFIDGFREATGWAGALYTDPSLEVYKAAGLKRGVLKTFNIAAGIRSIGTLRRGIKQGRTQGDNLQQGGVLVVARGGEVKWAHVSDYAGDNASVDEILAALRAS